MKLLWLTRFEGFMNAPAGSPKARLQLVYALIRLTTTVLSSPCDTSVRTSCHFARLTPDTDFFHHTSCTVHTVHSVCSPHTLVVNPLLTTITHHHIFSSVLAVPQYIYLQSTESSRKN